MPKKKKMSKKTKQNKKKCQTQIQVSFRNYTIRSLVFFHDKTKLNRWT